MLKKFTLMTGLLIVTFALTSCDELFNGSGCSSGTSAGIFALDGNFDFTGSFSGPVDLKYADGRERTLSLSFSVNHDDDASGNNVTGSFSNGEFSDSFFNSSASGSRINLYTSHINSQTGLLFAEYILHGNLANEAGTLVDFEISGNDSWGAFTGSRQFSKF